MKKIQELSHNSISRCGYAAIIGRPNVGKSTLLNHILGQKISITSRRPQTTRHRILGIKTTPEAQVIYVDTPGLHRAGKRAMNRYMNRVAASAIKDVEKESGCKIVVKSLSAFQPGYPRPAHRIIRNRNKKT